MDDGWVNVPAIHEPIVQIRAKRVTVELQRPNISGSQVASPFSLSIGFHKIRWLCLTPLDIPSSRRLPQEVSPPMLVERGIPFERQIGSLIPRRLVPLKRWVSISVKSRSGWTTTGSDYVDRIQAKDSRLIWQKCGTSSPQIKPTTTYTSSATLMHTTHSAFLTSLWILKPTGYSDLYSGYGKARLALHLPRCCRWLG
ncbi:uncharacterized protein LACBIDRAFT_321180 [Laccaria bicolor S238N-H82]|uniref:Predicted protein n=1 Tax=Laccaria bicolor (strain S238N-H82 / ATCC MYA-4686) TaxID=486041 RepID=B0CP02_LACBS|nr:uncharacterized protein LACBIDRAFT_321180 [Laccaria bicolor S238N-H82]EDR16026.1 predicted protein [Laccaria bicolor S238N-H82]|eukprot:XP_001874234.1 predicted protein [Laccaria bicolor S238N-H82]